MVVKIVQCGICVALALGGMWLSFNAWQVADSITPLSARDVNYYFGVTAMGLQWAGVGLVLLGNMGLVATLARISR